VKEIYGFGRKFWVCHEFRFGRNGFVMMLGWAVVMLFATGVDVDVLVLVVRDGCGYRCIAIGDGGSRQVL
jgi:hypothetical protein